MTNTSKQHSQVKHHVIEQGDYQLVFIGDIHGQHQKLLDLLKHIDFNYLDSGSSIEFMRLVFLGDLIDNKLEKNVDHLACLQLVKMLVDRGLAYCIMGNHEFNAIGWAEQNKNGLPLRDHSDNNYLQHRVFLSQIGENNKQHKYWIEWFKTLPLFLDFGNIRAIHACWHQKSIENINPFLNQDNSLKITMFPEAFNPQSKLYQFIETLLKGPEIDLPEGAFFFDKTNTKRTKIRLRWWLKSFETYQQSAQVQISMKPKIPTLPMPTEISFDEITIPVVIGHYTLEHFPTKLSDKVVCVDYNAAKGENPLVAYTWYAQTLTNEGTYENLCHENNFEFIMDDNQTITDGLDSLLQPIINSLPETKMTPAYNLFLTQVSEWLWNEWDPIGINDNQECRDEYEGYVQIFAKLACHLSQAELSAYISLICNYQLNISIDKVETESIRLAYDLKRIAESLHLK
ncbi:metallophosphoesterase [Shewanella sp. 10N.286.51.B8]|uniref:metallophosphoesterase n=1 Tax=Shewanella sp. 10N.286.51.B8 TaxID=3229708 RepID=UPI003551840B